MGKVKILKKLSPLHPIRFEYEGKIYETEDFYFIIKIMAKKKHQSISEFLENNMKSLKNLKII